MNVSELRSNRIERRIELTLLALFGVLFAYALAVWLRAIPGDGGRRPLGFVCLTGALLLQPIAALVRARSRTAFWTLLLVSTGLLALSFAIVAS